jgi:ectoine hydroxylase-related dioxygenase (phytanoyl-CoA dioxygenase family)
MTLEGLPSAVPSRFRAGTRGVSDTITGTMSTTSPSALPELTSPYAVTPDQAAAYRRDGHILLRGVASPTEVAAYRPAITAVVDEYRKGLKPLEDRDTYGKAFVQIGNLWKKSAAAMKFTIARRFAGIAAALMGVDRVRLYHDQALFKEAGGGITPWHQDQYYWPIDTPNTITMWMPLVDLTPEMGVMKFASKSHTGGLLQNLAISDKSEEAYDRFVSEKGFPVAGGAAMSAGDATFHTGWTLHRAPPNATATTREVMTIIWYADGAHIPELDTDGRKNDIAYIFPGKKTGDLAVGEITPLVWPTYQP